MKGEILATETIQNQEEPPKVGSWVSCLLWIAGGVLIGILLPQAEKGKNG